MRRRHVGQADADRRIALQTKRLAALHQPPPLRHQLRSGGFRPHRQPQVQPFTYRQRRVIQRVEPLHQFIPSGLIRLLRPLQLPFLQSLPPQSGGDLLQDMADPALADVLIGAHCLQQRRVAAGQRDAQIRAEKLAQRQHVQPAIAIERQMQRLLRQRPPEVVDDRQTLRIRAEKTPPLLRALRRERGAGRIVGTRRQDHRARRSAFRQPPPLFIHRQRQRPQTQVAQQRQ
ncbi:Uncharacterised protein [Serratia marcescens]|nr:Uncharacterised protein [Serratia marcescens]